MLEKGILWEQISDVIDVDVDMANNDSSDIVREWTDDPEIRCGKAAQSGRGDGQIDP